MTRNEARPRLAGRGRREGIHEQPGQAVRVHGTRIPASPSTPRHRRHFARLVGVLRTGDTGLAWFRVAGFLVSTPVCEFPEGPVMLPFAGEWRIPAACLRDMEADLDVAWARAGREVRP